MSEENLSKKSFFNCIALDGEVSNTDDEMIIMLVDSVMRRHRGCITFNLPHIKSPFDRDSLLCRIFATLLEYGKSVNKPIVLADPSVFILEAVATNKLDGDLLVVLKDEKACDFVQVKSLVEEISAKIPVIAVAYNSIQEVKICTSDSFSVSTIPTVEPTSEIGPSLSDELDKKDNEIKRLTDMNQSLESEKLSILDTQATLLQEKESFEKEKAALLQDNSDLKLINETLASEKLALEAEKETYQEIKTDLDKQVADLSEANKSIKLESEAKEAELNKRIEELTEDLKYSAINIQEREADLEEREKALQARLEALERDEADLENAIKEDEVEPENDEGPVGEVEPENDEEPVGEVEPENNEELVGEVENVGTDSQGSALQDPIEDKVEIPSMENESEDFEEESPSQETPTEPSPQQTPQSEPLFSDADIICASDGMSLAYLKAHPEKYNQMPCAQNPDYEFYVVNGTQPGIMVYYQHCISKHHLSLQQQG